MTLLNDAYNDLIAEMLHGDVEDRVHVLARHGRTILQADWVKELKRTSSLWTKERDPQSAG